jgi:hypothetical protein
MVLLAFSLQDQVEKYGSYVGIAAFFGLAILSLLYFAQAREVKRLREWAGRAPERAREVEEAALAAADAARRRPPPVAAPQAAPQPVAAATAAGGRSGSVSPAVPVAGTAVAEQERPEDESSQEDEPVVQGPVTADGKRPVAAKEPEVQPAAAEDSSDADADADAEPDGAERDEDDLRDEAADADTDGDGDGDEAAEAEPAPAPAAGSPTNGTPPAGAERTVFPAPSTAAGVASAAATPATATSAPAAAATPAPNRPAPAMPLRSAPPSASPRRAVTQPPRRVQPPPAPAAPDHGRRRWAIAGGVFAVIAALGVFAATQLLNDDKTPTTPNQAATPTASATESATASGGNAPTSRADTTVAVFNGTTVNGLASSTADKLAGSGYKRGSTGDYTDQQRAASIVFYRRNARTQARSIGRELNISDLRPMDAETQALAGQGADVAVVVGSDKTQ